MLCFLPKLLPLPPTKSDMDQSDVPFIKLVEQFQIKQKLWRLLLLFPRHIQVETVVWNETLARNAAVWASYLADNNLFEHATNIPNEGENLYMSTVVPNEPCTAATQAFYNEIKDYDFNKPGFSLETGHFTQVS